MRNSIFVPLALLTLAACVSSDFMPVGEKTYPPRPDDWVVEVFVAVEAPVRIHKSIEHSKSTDEIPANAELIGRVDAAGGEWAAWDSVIKEAKVRARSLGGDGLVVGSWGQHLTGVGSYGEAHYGKNLSFGVIRYQR